MEKSHKSHIYVFEINAFKDFKKIFHINKKIKVIRTLFFLILYKRYIQSIPKHFFLSLFVYLKKKTGF